jgi:hypothetical protein
MKVGEGQAAFIKHDIMRHINPTSGYI